MERGREKERVWEEERERKRLRVKSYDIHPLWFHMIYIN